MGTEMVQMMMIKLIFIFMIMVDVSKEIIRSILHLIFYFYVLNFTVYSILDIETIAQCYLCQKDLIIDFTNEILDFAEIERRTQNMKQIKPSL